MQTETGWLTGLSCSDGLEMVRSRPLTTCWISNDYISFGDIYLII